MSVMLLDVNRLERIAVTLLNWARTDRNLDLVVAITPTDDFSVGYEMVKDQARVRRLVLGFVNDLHRSNVSCWNLQYNDNEEIQAILPVGVPYMRVALVKTLQALRYNLMENNGEIQSFRGVYEKCERLIHAVEGAIVRALPEYDVAEW